MAEEILSAERRAALAHLGYGEPPELLEALAPAVERGHHIALLAGEGSGKEALYALAAGARCDPASPEVQGLVLCATEEAARRAARAAYGLNRELGLEALVWPPEEEPGEGGPPDRPVAHVLAGRPERLLREVRGGRLSLAALRLLAVDGVEALQETGGWEAAEALLDTLGSEGQKIVCALRPGEALDRLVERRLPRARRWPPELLGPGVGRERTEAAAGPALWYAAGAGEEERLAELARGLRQLVRETGGDRAFLQCPDALSAHRAAASLAAAGFRLAEGPDAPGVTVAWGADEEPPGGITALLGLPAGLAALKRWLEPARGRLVVTETAHVPQLRLLAERAEWPLREIPGGAYQPGRDVVARFRERVLRELEGGEEGTELLLLEPLLAAYGSTRVATALVRLLRRRHEEEAASTAPEAATEVSLRPAWTRIYVNVGKRDGAGPGDLVGAITGETEAAGAQVGKIDVRATFSLVEVDSQVADAVIRGLRGKRIRGREVVARVDREG